MDQPDIPHLIPLGLAERMEPMDLNLKKLIAGRLLIQGTSGAGKSWAIRRILEKSANLIQQIIVDPDGEFIELAGKYEIPTASLRSLTPDAAAALGERVRRHRTSILVNATELDPDSFAERIAAFLGALVDQTQEHWHPALLVIDEAHLVAPQGASRSSDGAAKRLATGALIDVMARGRKRGIGTIIATQRLAKLAQSVASEAANVMIGQNMLMRDMVRAGELLGWTAEKAEVLRDLTPGHFYVVGPALSNYPKKVLVGSVKTRHAGETPDLTLPPDFDIDQARALLEIDAIQSPEIKPIVSPVSFRTGDRFHRFVMMPEAVTALRILHALAEISPNASEAENLRNHLSVTPDDMASALTLLAGEKMIETRVLSGEQLIRLSSDLRRSVSALPVTRLAS